ncbi:MAG: transketolase, partial [Bacteroidetes bacterium]
LRYVRNENIPEKEELKNRLKQSLEDKKEKYSSKLYNEYPTSCLNVAPVAPEYPEDPEMVDGRIVLRDNFDKILEKYPEVSIFGEDSGKIGGVNQGLEGLQKKYGEIRVFDTGIREATIVGQGVGMAMRGLRPIAEIQYLDYLLFGLEVMSDDLATVQYRTKGTQQAPLIIRTRGHRLEGIWHSGSPMGMIINAVRGMYVCVPRNMTQAAGMYNTLLEGNDPALVIESLNGYRLKEPYPSNIGEFKVPVGIPEIMTEGEDLTIVTYGSLVRMAVEAAKQLREAGISAEVIDVQTLLPFDIPKTIVKSLEKTNKVLFLDEDVPGGASAFMMQKVLEEQKGYLYLDAAPKTLTAKEHRPAYGTDGDYFSKPSIEDIFDAAYEIMHEYNPKKYPAIY